MEAGFRLAFASPPHETENTALILQLTLHPATRSLICRIFQQVCAIAGETPLTRGVCGWIVLVRRSGEAGSEQAVRLRYAWHGAPSQGEQLSNGRVTWSRAGREWEQPWRLNHSCGMERERHAQMCLQKRYAEGWEAEETVGGTGYLGSGQTTGDESERLSAAFHARAMARWEGPQRNDKAWAWVSNSSVCLKQNKHA